MEDYVRARQVERARRSALETTPSLVAQAEAIDHGCDQVVWLDANEHRWVEEMGGMNLFFVFGSGADARLMTPSLSGSLLPGSLGICCPTGGDLGYQVEKAASTSMTGARRANRASSPKFSHVGRLPSSRQWVPSRGQGHWTIGGENQMITMQLREHLLGLQTGAIADQHGWSAPSASRRRSRIVSPLCVRTFLQIPTVLPFLGRSLAPKWQHEGACRAAPSQCDTKRVTLVARIII